MSYYTNFNFKFYDKGSGIELSRKDSKEIINDIESTFKYRAEEDSEMFTIGANWHSFDEDMKKFSTKYPNILFEIFGEGEETDDIWKQYILNGKLEECMGKIVYPCFENKTKQEIVNMFNSEK